MGRVNKLTEGVFVDIIGNESQVSKPNVFLSYGSQLKSNKDLNVFTEMYTETVNEVKTSMAKLASLEKIILQMRAKLNMDDVKFSILREYIYARTPFYRDDISTKDIRVIVDKTDIQGDDVSKLLGSKVLVKSAKQKLASAMEDEINKSIKEFHKLTN